MSRHVDLHGKTLLPGLRALYPTDVLLTRAGTAEVIHVTEQTVTAYSKDPDDPLPLIRLGPRAVRISAHALISWLERRVANATAPPPPVPTMQKKKIAAGPRRAVLVEPPSRGRKIARGVTA